MGELIWERIGFGLVGAISGLIYALAISTILVPLIEALKLQHLLLSFISTFGIAGLILGRMVSEAAFGALSALYYLWGYLLGILGISGYVISGNEAPSKKSGGMAFFVAGLFVALACVVIIT